MEGSRSARLSVSFEIKTILQYFSEINQGLIYFIFRAHGLKIRVYFLSDAAVSCELKKSRQYNNNSCAG